LFDLGAHFGCLASLQCPAPSLILGRCKTTSTRMRTHSSTARTLVSMSSFLVGLPDDFKTLLTNSEIIFSLAFKEIFATCPNLLLDLFLGLASGSVPE